MYSRQLENYNAITALYVSGRLIKTVIMQIHGMHMHFKFIYSFQFSVHAILITVKFPAIIVIF